MTIKIGTIEEMTGVGFEYLLDSETRTYVIAKFFNGNFIEKLDSQPRLITPANAQEKTIVATA